MGGGLGGGISNEINGIVTLNSSTISGNTASGIHALGGGIYNENGTITLTDSTVSDNTASGSASAYGGGILNDLAGTVSLTNSTISGNTAGNDGGGIENYGTTTLTNSTVSGNTAHGYGGGIDNWGPNAVLTLHSSLISGNTVIIDGDEIYNSDDPLYTGTVTVDSSNLFGHSGKSSAEVLYGFSPGTSDITATSDGTDSTSLSAILDITLADNGGPTMTHALVKGSPAVDLDRECSTNLAEDQRGEPRPLGKGCDAGSFESVYSVSPKAMPWIYMLLL